jgi:hypothetical protein
VSSTSLLGRTIGVALTLAACSRTSGTADAGSDATSTSGAPPPANGAAPSTSVADTPASARRPSSASPSSGLEARRSIVTHIESDPLLSANAEALRKQHGGALPASLAVQSTELDADHHRAIIVGAERKDGTLESPMLFVVDEQGALAWSKERPTAGIKAPIGPLAIATGPSGRFAMAACDPPTSSVALRLWDSDGSPFADFQALETKACDAITLLHWPQHGWIIAIAAGPEIRAQLVTDQGALSWGQGMIVGARFRTIVPVSLAVSDKNSFFLVQYSQSPTTDRDVDHALAYRYDERGTPLWPMPIDLGAVRRVAPGQERIVLARASDRALTATLTGGVVMELRPNGETRRIP